MELNSGQISISELLDKNYIFEIPTYQRGYRWEKTEVVDLLEDIDSIGEKDKPGDDLKEYCEQNMYCLQPISLDQGEDKTKKVVVDGQQRLTTIFLLINYLSNEIANFSDDAKRLVSIDEIEHLNKNIELEYKDKSRNTVFKKIEKSLDTINDEDIDSYYITKAYQNISSWFSKHENKEQYIKKFAIKFYYGTSVIIYDIVPEFDGEPYDYFAKTNTGRIPLTNSELIKAIIMLEEYCVNEIENKGSYYEEKKKDPYYQAARDTIMKERLENTRVRMSRQWDSVENQLRKDEFWYFLSNDSDKYEDTRIDYIFDMIAKKYYEYVKEELGEYDKKTFFDMNSEKGSFTVIAHYLRMLYTSDSDEPVGEIIWNSVWEAYLRLEEWFNNYEWYHLVGYLLNSNNNFDVEGIIKYFDGEENSFQNKNVIKKILIEKIEEQVGLLDKDKSHKKNSAEYREYLESLDYDKKGHTSVIKNIILLFNVLSVLGDYRQEKKGKEKHNRIRDAFFPFARYKKEKWQLEHIHSKEDDSFEENNAIDLIKYLEQMKDYLQGGPHKEECEFIDELLEYNEKRTEELINDGEMRKNAIKIAGEEIYAKWIEKFEQEFKDNYINGIGNMTLLDSNTNQSYKNAPFFIKRMVIREIVMGEKEYVSKFIPVCTRNVFDKTYTNSPHSMMVWNNNDYEDYLSVIVKTILNNLEGESENE